MTPEQLRAMEVRPINAGEYQVIVYYYVDPSDGRIVLETDRYYDMRLTFDGERWQYETHGNYVCFIYERHS